MEYVIKTAHGTYYTGRPPMRWGDRWGDQRHAQRFATKAIAAVTLADYPHAQARIVKLTPKRTPAVLAMVL